MAASKAFHYVTHQATYPGPHCFSSHVLNGACNSLSCTISLWVIRARAAAHFICMHTTSCSQLGNSQGPGFHVGAHRPSPHPWKISHSGQTFHHCNVKIQRKNMEDGVVCDRNMPAVVFYCNSKSSIFLRRHLKNKKAFSVSYNLPLNQWGKQLHFFLKKYNSFSDKILWINSMLEPLCSSSSNMWIIKWKNFDNEVIK